MAPLTAAQARAAVQKVKAEARASGKVYARRGVKITAAMTATGSGAVQFREVRLLEEEARRVEAALRKRARARKGASKARAAK